MNPAEKRRWMEAITLKMKSIGPLAQQAASETLDAMGECGIEFRWCVGRAPKWWRKKKGKESGNDQMS